MTSAFNDFGVDGLDPATPPAGRVRMFPKADGMYLKLSSGVEKKMFLPEGLTAGDVLVWNGTNFLPAQLPDDFEELINGDSDFDDFISGASGSALNWTVGVSGAGATAQVSTLEVAQNASGVAQISTGTTATGRGAYNCAANVQLGGMPVVIEARIKIPVLSTGTEQFRFQVGLGNQGNSAADQTNGVFFEHFSDSGFWKRCVADNASVIKTPTTAPVQAGAWVRLKIVINAAGTQAEFFVNGVSVGIENTLIPVAATRNVGHVFRILKTIGTTSSFAYIDFFYYKFGSYTVPR
jgi:hypothetical protein